MLFLAAALHARAQSGDLDRARAELEDAEIAYEKSLVVYLRCGVPGDDFDELVGRQARALGVGDFTLTHMAGSEAVPTSALRITRMQIHGRGEFGDVGIGPEERMMRERFGRVYEAYASRTKRLVPTIW